MNGQPSTEVHQAASRVVRKPATLRSSVQRIARLARKELRESLRDRRTLTTLIMMPLIVYPLLGSVVQKFAISRIDPNAPAAIVIFEESVSQGIQLLFDNSKESQKAVEDSTGNKPESGGSGADNEASQQIESITNKALSGELSSDIVDRVVRLEAFVQPVGSDSSAAVRDGIADVAILEFPAKPDAKTGKMQPGTVEIVSRQGDAFSTKAAAEVEKRVALYRDQVVRMLLDQTRLGGVALPFVSRATVTSSAPKESPLSAFVPLMLVLMTMTGAVYPAIDLTAGERERGTLEMLIAAPVPRRDLLTGKFIAVFTVAVLTAIINLTAMILTLYGTGFDRVILGDGASIGMFLQVLAMLVVFASFFSAVLLSITSFARSFREAQAWLIPLMLVSLAPGILSLMPGIRLTPGLSIIPLVNIVLLGKELFQGIASPVCFIITLAATLTYTVLALRLASNVFGSDTVLFGSNASVGGLSKRPSQETDHVPLKLGLGYLAVLVPGFIVLAGLRGRIVAPENLPGQLVLSGIMTIGLFALLPVLLTSWNRIRFAEAFAIRNFSALALVGAVLLGGTLWALTYEALLLGKGASGWTQLLSNPKLQELAKQLTSETPLLLRLLTLAVIPAICEELFFRGFLMSALCKTSGQWKSALFTSTFLFAAFHVIVDVSLTLERFPATFLLGLVLGWIRITSGSVLPGMAMHVVSNGLLLSLSNLQPLLQKLGLDLAVKNEAHLPAGFLAGASVVALVGVLLVWKSSSSRKTQLASE